VGGGVGGVGLGIGGAVGGGGGGVVVVGVAVGVAVAMVGLFHNLEACRRKLVVVTILGAVVDMNIYSQLYTLGNCNYDTQYQYQCSIAVIHNYYNHFVSFFVHRNTHRKKF